MKYKTWVISDPHFWHSGVINFQNRPFDNVEEMNEALITNWNDIVDDNDLVYILGDFSFSGWNKAVEILDRLNGRKILIVGNHDKRWMKNKDLSPYFEEVVEYKKIRYDGYKIVMCHYPIACWASMERGSIHLYGHIHSNSHTLPEGFNREQSYNVGVDTNHYKPVDLDWIIKLMDMRKEPEKHIPKDTIYCYDKDGICPFYDYADNMGEQNNGICRFTDESDFEINIKNNNNDDGCWAEHNKDTGNFDPMQGTTAELFGEQFPHSLLWDQCKQCFINEGLEEE